MRFAFLIILLTMSILMTACGGDNGLEPIERTQTAVAGTQAALSIGPTQTALADIQTTQAAAAWTDTPTPTPTETPDPLQAAFTPVTRNTDWTPIEQDFDGVTMVLVPAGCFMMGREGGDDEQPVHEQCFDEPFWIDRYEVTNEQYGGTSISTTCSDRSSESDQPRNCVDWFDARDHCEARDGVAGNVRLPTEAEWEYAARGPDSLLYPWGNDFEENNVVYSSNSGGQTAPVGSRPGGASWVGAMDLSGNLKEWTSSLYVDYPYDDDHENNSDTSSGPVSRGGSFDMTSRYLWSAHRSWGHFETFSSFIGFRCARSFDAP